MNIPTFSPDSLPEQLKNIKAVKPEIKIIGIMSIFLGVNIDHIATLRQARGTKYPSLIDAALICENSSGADSITVHLREDERHIKPEDVISLKNKLTKPLNLEMALTDKMLSFAIKIKPKYVCFVPEKRKELTTEGGLNLFYNESFLTKAINKLKKNNIEVSLFIDPEIRNVKQALKLKVNNIELHTGTYCNFLINKKKDKAKKEFNKINPRQFLLIKKI